VTIQVRYENDKQILVSSKIQQFWVTETDIGELKIHITYQE